MRILLAGATGAIGRPLVRRLVEAGHEVVGLTRSPERVAGLEAAGARGVVGDVLDLEAVRAAARAARPEVVMDQTTALPQRYDPRRMDRFYKDMGPLRLIGSPNLLDVAREHDARHVFQSVAFLYAPGSGGLCTEEDPAFLEDAPPPWDSVLLGITAFEQRTVAHGGMVLRYGFFYGPGTHYGEGGQVHEDVRKRRFPLVGDGEGVFSFIHVEDAATATVAAAEHFEPGIFNVVDDRPLATREWLPAFAERIGAKPPRRLPALVARPFAGPLAMHWMTTMPGAANGKARERFGWAPRYPVLTEGLGA